MARSEITHLARSFPQRRAIWIIRDATGRWMLLRWPPCWPPSGTPAGPARSSGARPRGADCPCGPEPASLAGLPGTSPARSRGPPPAPERASPAGQPAHGCAPDANDAPWRSVISGRCGWPAFPLPNRWILVHCRIRRPLTRTCPPGCWSTCMWNSLLVLAAAILSLCMLRLRRPSADSRPAAFALAEAADTERIRRQAQDAVIAFGEELRDAPPSQGALDASPRRPPWSWTRPRRWPTWPGCSSLSTSDAVARRHVCSTRCTARRPGRSPGGSSAAGSSFGCPPAVPAHKRSAAACRWKSCRTPCTRSTFLTSMSIRAIALGRDRIRRLSGDLVERVLLGDFDHRRRL